MSNKELYSQQGTLESESEILANVLLKNGLQQGPHSRKTIEDLFNNYARIVMGTPGTMMGIDVTKEDFAAVLILREIMHHLDFVSISNPLIQITKEIHNPKTFSLLQILYMFHFSMMYHQQTNLLLLL